MIIKGKEESAKRGQVAVSGHVGLGLWEMGGVFQGVRVNVSNGVCGSKVMVLEMLHFVW